MLQFQSVWVKCAQKCAIHAKTLKFKEFFKKGEMKIAYV